MSNCGEVQERVIVHFDVDAFYVACERELNASLRNVPVAVSQYNPHGVLRQTSKNDPERLIVHPQKVSGGANPMLASSNGDENGSLIAVSYEARAHGVKRNDRGLEAVRKCPDLRIVQVPIKRSKADLTIYREASQRVIKSLSNAIKSAVAELYENLQGCHSPSVPLSLRSVVIEKASVDEIYIDLTKPAHSIAEQIRHLENKDSKGTCMAFRNFILESLVASSTTIGGCETGDVAIATNSLSKDEVRRGSCLQVLDSSNANSDLASESNVWWNRPWLEWTYHEVLLACGSSIAALARASILREYNGTYTLSAGISSNKTMAKLASGFKKPNRQTLINPGDESTLQKLFHPLPIGRIKGLGGKFGDEVASKLSVNTVGDIAKLSLATISASFPEQAQFIFNIAQGRCLEEVIERLRPNSIGAGKTFRGALSFSASDRDALKKWIVALCDEVVERLETERAEHDRIPQKIVVGVHFLDQKGSYSRSSSVRSAFETYSDICLKLVREIVSSTANSVILGMSVTASGFVDVTCGRGSISDAFGKACGQDIDSCRRAYKRSWSQRVENTLEVGGLPPSTGAQGLLAREQKVGDKGSQKGLHAGAGSASILGYFSSKSYQEQSSILKCQKIKKANGYDETTGDQAQFHSCKPLSQPKASYTLAMRSQVEMFEALGLEGVNPEVLCELGPEAVHEILTELKQEYRDRTGTKQSKGEKSLKSFFASK